MMEDNKAALSEESRAPKPSKRKPAKSPSFEEALTELESLVKRLEAGEISLEESMAVYERGVKLTALCSSCLKNAKLKMEELKRTQNDE